MLYRAPQLKHGFAVANPTFSKSDPLARITRSSLEDAWFNEVLGPSGPNQIRTDAGGDYHEIFAQPDLLAEK